MPVCFSLTVLWCSEVCVKCVVFHIKCVNCVYQMCNLHNHKMKLWRKARPLSLCSSAELFLPFLRFSISSTFPLMSCIFTNIQSDLQSFFKCCDPVLLSFKPPRPSGRKRNFSTKRTEISSSWAVCSWSFVGVWSQHDDLMEIYESEINFMEQQLVASMFFPKLKFSAGSTVLVNICTLHNSSFQFRIHLFYIVKFYFYTCFLSTCCFAPQQEDKFLVCENLLYRISWTYFLTKAPKSEILYIHYSVIYRWIHVYVYRFCSLTSACWCLLLLFPSQIKNTHTILLNKSWFLFFSFHFFKHFLWHMSCTGSLCTLIDLFYFSCVCDESLQVSCVWSC